MIDDAPAHASRFPPIHVGLTESHGMAAEVSQHPSPNVCYSFLQPIPTPRRWIRSPIKGFMRFYEPSDCDLIEAILSPIQTDRPWILSLSNFQEAVAFNLRGIPIPRSLRIAYIQNLLLRENCKKILFWSEAGKQSLIGYGRVRDQRILRKVEVVYPAVRKMPDSMISFSDRTADVQICFSGLFFRKGGVNVVDAFEQAQRVYPRIKLRLCCNEEVDFATENQALRTEYLDRIRSNSAITMARATRDQLLHQILPQTDIFVLPTYVETFGFAILEAMALGLPIISTNHFAIPEMIEHDVSGLLVDTQAFDCERMFRGYTVEQIPRDFRQHVTNSLLAHLLRLIESPEERIRLGLAALQTARSRFHFERRNARMEAIYREALS